jgi:WD40 repeat protein
VRTLSFGRGNLALVADAGGAQLFDLSNRSGPSNPAFSSGNIAAAAISEDGRSVLLGAAGNPGVAELWDITRPAKPRQVASGALCSPISVGLNAAKALAMIGCSDGSIALWRDDGHQTLTKIASFPTVHGLHGIALSRTGSAAMIASDGGTTSWDIEATAGRSRPVLRASALIDAAPAYAVALDQQADLAIVGHSGGNAAIDRPNSAVFYFEDQALAMDNRTGKVLAVDISADGHTAITGLEGGEAVVWAVDASNGGWAPRAILDGHAAVTAVALSPDGQIALTGTRDGTTSMWTLGQDLYARRGTMTGYRADVDAVATSGASSTTVTVSAGKASVWDIADPGHPRPDSALPSASAVRSVAADPAADVFATGDAHGTVSVWDLTDPARPGNLAQVTSGRGAIGSVAFNRNGSRMAVGGDDGVITLWDVAAATQPRRLCTISVGAAVRGISLNSTGTTLAVGASDGKVTIWDVADPGHPRRYGELLRTVGLLRALAFSPTAPLLLVADDREQVTQWDLTNPAAAQQRTSLRGQTDIVNGLSYNSAGTMAVTVSRDGTAGVWSVIDPYQPQQLATLTGHRGSVLGAAFSADSTTLVSVADDRIGIVWDISKLAAIVAGPKQSACRAAGGGFDPDQWTHHLSDDLPYLVSC